MDVCVCICVIMYMVYDYVCASVRMGICGCACVCACVCVHGRMCIAFVLGLRYKQHTMNKSKCKCNRESVFAAILIFPGIIFDECSGDILASKPSPIHHSCKVCGQRHAHKTHPHTSSLTTFVCPNLHNVPIMQGLGANVCEHIFVVLGIHLQVHQLRVVEIAKNNCLRGLTYKGCLPICLADLLRIFPRRSILLRIVQAASSAMLAMISRAFRGGPGNAEKASSGHLLLELLRLDVRRACTREAKIGISRMPRGAGSWDS